MYHHSYNDEELTELANMVNFRDAADGDEGTSEPRHHSQRG